MASRRPKSSAKRSLAADVPEMKDEKQVFYVNVTIHDASAVIYEKVTEKIKAKQSSLPGPQSLKNKVASSVAAKAAKKVPPAKIAEKMAQKMCKMLPYKMKTKGLTVVAEQVFQEGPYFVLQLQVQHVDAIKLAEEAQKGEDDDDDESISSEDLDAAIEKQKEEDVRATSTTTLATVKREGLVGYIEWFLDFIGVRYRTQLEENYLPALIQSRMSTTMGQVLRKQLEGKKIQADAEALPEAKQARYFFANLKKARNVEKL